MDDGANQYRHHLVVAAQQARKACAKARAEYDDLADLLAVNGHPQEVSRVDHLGQVTPQGLYMGIAAHRDGLGADPMVAASVAQMARVLMAYANSKKKCLLGWALCVLALLPGFMGWI